MTDFSTIEHLKSGNQKHVLASKDENFRLEIIKLKQKGYKTEPEFGFLLGLKTILIWNYFILKLNPIHKPLSSTHQTTVC